MNASLSSIRAGLKPVIQDKAGDYFRFANGQIRRQIGQGHSRVERSARRLAKRERQRRVRIGNHILDPQCLSAKSNTAVVLQRLREAMQWAADKAAISSL